MLCCSNGCCTSSNLKSFNNLLNTTSSFLLCGSGHGRQRAQQGGHAETINDPQQQLQYHHQLTHHPEQQQRYPQHPQQPFTMVLQPDFRKVSGLSSTTLKLLEAVENDHDSTTAAALAAVEKRGEMLVRILDPRVQFSRGRQDMVRKWLDMETPSSPIHFTEIVKRPGQTLGLYIREGNGLDRYDGVFISRIAIESAVFNSGCLGVGDEILAVNLIDVRNMSLDDVVIIMSIPRRLVLTIRGRRGGGSSGAQQQHGHQRLPVGSSSHPPVVVMKKDLYSYGGENNGESTGTSEDQQHPQMIPPPRGGRQMYPPQQHQPSSSYHYNTYQPTYSNIGVGVYQPPPHRESQMGMGSLRSGAYGTSITTPRHQPQLYSSTTSHYANYPQNLPTVPPPDVTLSGGSSSIAGGYEYEEQAYQHGHRPPSRGIGIPTHGHSGSGGVSDFYQPPPPLIGSAHPSSGPYSALHGVITDQPRSSRFARDFHQQRLPADTASYDQAHAHYYPRTLESLAEKVHTFYTAPRPLKNGGQRASGRGTNLRLSGSDYRLGSGRMGLEYGSSLPRGWSASGAPKASSSIKSMQLLKPHQQGSLQRGLTRPILDYSSDTEAQIYSSRSRIMSDYLRSTATSQEPQSHQSLLTNRFSGSSSRLLIGPSSNYRSNSLPRDFNMFKRTPSSLTYDMELMDEDMTSASLAQAIAPTRSILRKSGSNIRSAVSRQQRQPTASSYLPYRRTPSTSAIYEQLKASRPTQQFSLRDPLKDLNTGNIHSRRSESDAISELNNWLREEEEKYRERGMKKSGGVLSILGQQQQRSSSPLTTARRTLMSSTAASTTTFNLPTSISFRDNLSSSTLSRLANLTSSSSGFNLVGSKAQQLSPLITSSKLRKSQITSSTVVSPSLQNLLTKSTSAGPQPISMPMHSPALMDRSASSTTSTISTSGPSGPPNVPNLLIINPSEFIRYKPGIESGSPAHTHGHTHGITGMLNLHLLAGRALRSSSVSKHSTHHGTSTTTSFDPATASSHHHRDLYCVIELDRTHRSRTVVYTGDQNFDWNEYFNIDLYNNYDLDFLIYSWDPELRHRLCYKSSLNLVELLGRSTQNNKHNLAIKVEPRGTLYVKIEYCRPEIVYQRVWREGDLFGEHLNSVMEVECGMRNESTAAPTIVLKCIEEIERRGLDIVGVYRLCGGGEKKENCKNAWREEWNKIRMRSQNNIVVSGGPGVGEIYKNILMSAEVVPDINVVGGVLKDYLLSLPTPLIPPGIYMMLRDAMDVCLPDDPEGNSKLLVGVVECLEKWERSTLFTLLDHLTLITSLSTRNRMTATELSKIFAPLTMIHCKSPNQIARVDSEVDSGNSDFPGCIRAFEYLLNGWGVWRGSSSSSGSTIMAGLGGGSGSNTSSSGVCRTVLGSEDRLKRFTKNGKSLEMGVMEELENSKNQQQQKTNGHHHQLPTQGLEQYQQLALDTTSTPEKQQNITTRQESEELHLKTPVAIGLLVESNKRTNGHTRSEIEGESIRENYEKYLSETNNRNLSQGISSTKKVNGQSAQAHVSEAQPQAPPIPKPTYQSHQARSMSQESSFEDTAPLNELQMKLNRRRRSIDAEEAESQSQQYASPGPGSVDSPSTTKKTPPVPPPKPSQVHRTDSIKRQDSQSNVLPAPPPVPPRRGSIPSSPDTGGGTIDSGKPSPASSIAPPPVPPRLGKSMSIEQQQQDTSAPSTSVTQEPIDPLSYPPPTTQPPMLDLSNPMLNTGSGLVLHHSPHLSSSFDPSVSSDCYTINEEEDYGDSNNSCWYQEEDEEDQQDTNSRGGRRDSRNSEDDQDEDYLN